MIESIFVLAAFVPKLGAAPIRSLRRDREFGPSAGPSAPMELALRIDTDRP